MPSHSRARRAIATLLVLAQASIGVTLAAQSTPARSGPPAPPRVTVRREVPRVAKPSQMPVFSSRPTIQEIRQARVFVEPLVPVGRPPTDAETAALASAITAYRQRNQVDHLGDFRLFLEQHRDTPWRPSLEANLAQVLWTQGEFSSALAHWDDAWQLAKDVDTVEGRAVAAIAMAGALDVLATLGMAQQLEARLAVIDDRPLSGAAAARVRRARQTLTHLRDQPDLVIPSGSQAIEVLRSRREGRDVQVVPPRTGGAAGETLADVERAAVGAGLDLVAVHRPFGHPLPVPAIVHLTFGHYAPVLEQRDGRYRLTDPALGGDRWLSLATLDSETSGFVLVPKASVAPEWRRLSVDELTRTVGHSCVAGGTGNNEPCPRSGVGGGSGGGSGPTSASSCGGGPNCKMPGFELKPENAGLAIVDTPVGYTPPRGPAVPFTLTYDHRQELQPQLFTFGHIGTRWSLNWMSYAQEVPFWINPSWNNESVPAHVSVRLRESGEEIFHTPDGAGVYPAHWRSRAHLVRVSADPIRYERRLPDGRTEVFGLADTAPAGQRRVFLTEVRDAHGLAVSLTYDAQFRLVAVTDALGQVSTLEYADAADPLRLTRIEDPFGRAATVTFNGAGQLESITDVGGLRSAFAYAGGDFIASMTTPYGTTTFLHEGTDPSNHPYVQATDPLGGIRRVEYHIATAAIPASVPAAEVPAGFSAWNDRLNQYVTLIWDSRGSAADPGNPATATAVRWFLNGWAGSFTQLQTTRVPQYVQRPGEARTWYAYPGQNQAAVQTMTGWATTPSVTARVLDDGTTQQWRTSVNTQGSVTERIDPLGRRTAYDYAANGVDLLAVRQTTGTANDVVASYANYTAGHLPQSITDAAGQTTALTYNAAGQVLTVTNPLSETTTYAYTGDGHLASVTGPVSGATTSYTYDGYGRPRTVTHDGATVTTDYDVFDRPTVVWHPDGTTDRTTYDRLDVARQTDRLGRVTVQVHDALQRRVATRDPAGRVVRQTFGGTQDGLIDANGQATTWHRDLLGRVTREVRADGTSETFYSYEPRSGRLSSVTDPKGQLTTYGYALDDALLSLTFSNATIATPGVTYTYDATYGRTATMLDGTGTTTWAYHPAGQAGAGQVAAVDGPLTNDTIAYTYDVLGRVTGRTINGAANSLTLAYDALGRVTTETNVLGTFTYGYDGTSGRLASVTYPNGQTSSYAYLSATQDHRLQTIHHQLPGPTTLSRFDYTYDAVGNIVTWQQQAGTAAPELWRYTYDRADQLIGAVVLSTGPTPTTLKRYAYGYDPAGNRLFEQIDDAVTAWTYDPLNRLQTQAGGGVLQVEGLVNEPAQVTIQGQAAAVNAAGQFQGGLPVAPGANVFTVRATDPNGNTATAQYQVDVSSAPKTFTYDANGNMTTDGARLFEWDARNQLVAVTVGTHRSEFTYDGQQRRVRQIEKESGVTQGDAQVLWCETGICEEREPDGGTVTRRAYGYGEQVAGQVRYFVTDHLGSVSHLTDVERTLLAAFSFDSFGRRTAIGGPAVTNVGFTGHQTHGQSGLVLTLHRAYDAALGRWTSEDPLGGIDGENWSAYVRSNPLRFVDPWGLASCECEAQMKMPCLEQVFGQPVGGIRITEKPPNKKWAATTRKNEIIVYGTCGDFFEDDDTVLEEYYHVLEQWNKGRINRFKYGLAFVFGGYDNKYEREAKAWVSDNIGRYIDCLKK